ncbi:hypothetical protein ACQZV8_19270 [Magnetococcales bacterium HHB-1]
MSRQSEMQLRTISLSLDADYKNIGIVQKWVDKNLSKSGRQSMLNNLRQRKAESTKSRVSIPLDSEVKKRLDEFKEREELNTLAHALEGLLDVEEKFREMSVLDHLQCVWEQADDDEKREILNWAGIHATAEEPSKVKAPTQESDNKENHSQEALDIIRQYREQNPPVGYKQIATILSDRGFVPSRSKEWTRSSVRHQWLKMEKGLKQGSG